MEAHAVSVYQRLVSPQASSSRPATAPLPTATRRNGGGLEKMTLTFPEGSPRCASSQLRIEWL